MPPRKGSFLYTVKKKDNLFKISEQLKRQGILATPDRISRANPAVKTVRPGQVLRIPRRKREEEERIPEGAGLPRRAQVPEGAGVLVRPPARPRFDTEIPGVTPTAPTLPERRLRPAGVPVPQARPPVPPIQEANPVIRSVTRAAEAIMGTGLAQTAARGFATAAPLLRTTPLGQLVNIPAAAEQAIQGTRRFGEVFGAGLEAARGLPPGEQPRAFTGGALGELLPEGTGIPPERRRVSARVPRAVGRVAGERRDVGESLAAPEGFGAYGVTRPTPPGSRPSGGFYRDEYGRLFATTEPHYVVTASGFLRGEYPTWVLASDQEALGWSDEDLIAAGYFKTAEGHWIRGDPRLETPTFGGGGDGYYRRGRRGYRGGGGGGGGGGYTPQPPVRYAEEGTGRDVFARQEFLNVPASYGLVTWRI